MDPFWILPIGRDFIKNSFNRWVSGDTTVLFYSVPYDPVRPPRSLSICMNPDVCFDEGKAAVIWANAAKGLNQGDQYYLGSITSRKKSISATKCEISPSVTQIILCFNIMDESRVTKIHEAQQEEWTRYGSDPSPLERRKRGPYREES